MYQLNIVNIKFRDLLQAWTCAIEVDMFDSCFEQQGLSRMDVGQSNPEESRVSCSFESVITQEVSITMICSVDIASFLCLDAHFVSRMDGASYAYFQIRDFCQNLAH